MDQTLKIIQGRNEAHVETAVTTTVSPCAAAPVLPGGSRAGAPRRHNAAAALRFRESLAQPLSGCPWHPPRQTSDRPTLRAVPYPQDNSRRKPLRRLPSTYEKPGSPTSAESPD